MTEFGRIPADVEARMRARLAAHKTRHLPCAGCGAPPEVSPHGCTRWGGMYCPACWARLPRQVATVDPSRTAAGLRQAAAARAAREDASP